MSLDVELPKLADTLVEGTVARWLKQPGDRVRKGEPLVEIETDKVNSELEAPADGVLAEILVPAGETVPVGQVIARIGETEASAATAAVPETAATPETPVGVHHAMSAAPAPAPSGGGLSSMRRRIAERVQEARARIPQGSCVREVDLSGVDRSGASWTACFVKALAAASGESGIGVAVEVPSGDGGESGLVVPVLRDVGGRSLDDVSAALADLVERARTGRLEPAEVGGAGFTVTNVGGGGTLMAFPLVSPGEAGILAPGAIRDGRCYLTLGYDRRRYDDWAADRLLARIAEELTRL